MIIPLGPPLPVGSSNQPGDIVRATRPLRGLAPGGVCRAPLVTEGAVRSYRTFSPLPPNHGGGLFSVALSFRSPRLAVSQHPALWSSDFPPVQPVVRRTGDHLRSSGGGGGGTSCGTPGNLTATATSTTSALVSWGAVTGAGSYQLSYKLSSSSTWSNPVNLTSTSYTLNGLTAASTYNVRVSATCSGVVSGFATASFSTGGGGTTCGAPANLTATATSSTVANITWNAGSGASYYQLYYKPASSSYWSSAINVTGTAYNLSGLAASTTYNVRVRTVCSSGSSGFVSTTFTTQASGGGTTCATPANFTLVNVTATSAIISWNTVSGATGYDLQIKLSTSGTWMTFVNLPTTVVQITNMLPARTYNARVRARCTGTNNFSPYSAILNINTPANVTGTETPVALPDGEGETISLQHAAISEAEGLRVSPNPTTGWVTVNFHSETNEASVIEWFDLNGRLLVMQPASGKDNSREFDLGNYPPGIYFVRVYAKDQEPMIRRVVKE